MATRSPALKIEDMLQHSLFQLSSLRNQSSLHLVLVFKTSPCTLIGICHTQDRLSIFQDSFKQKYSGINWFYIFTLFSSSTTLPSGPYFVLQIKFFRAPAPNNFVSAPNFSSSEADQG